MAIPPRYALKLTLSNVDDLFVNVPLLLGTSAQQTIRARLLIRRGQPLVRE